MYRDPRPEPMPADYAPLPSTQLLLTGEMYPPVAAKTEKVSPLPFSIGEISF